jgi:SAM-dependent methyltransferase
MDADSVLAMARRYQESCVLGAAAQLDVFAALAARPLSAAELAERLELDPRGTAILLDALAALALVAKRDDSYVLPAAIAPLLTSMGPGSVLAMVRHQANCLRRWAQLARVVKSGRPAERTPSVRGEGGDREAFIGAMDEISTPVADAVVAELALPFRHLLDLGGGPGTWTRAFLDSEPRGCGTLFDLPPVIPLARRRLEAAGMLDRVELVPGDFATDPLPRGADLAWVSAIVHQNSRAQNRKLLAEVHRALVPGGLVAIRDIVMEPDRTAPPGGTLFAVNMLVATEGGGTFTLEELREDLEAAGFAEVTLLRRDPWMSSVVTGRRPE